MALLDFSLQTIMIGVAIFLLLTWRSIRKPNNLPPGPWGWPFVGYLPNLFIQMRTTGLTLPKLLVRLAKEYGDIYSVRFAGKVVVVLNGYDVIKEAFQNPKLVDRPQSKRITENGNDKGIAYANGELWKNLRKFTLTTLRSFGVGKRSFEEEIVKETKALLDEISLKVEPFDPHILLENATANIICSVVLGRRYDYADPQFLTHLKTMGKQMERMGSGGMMVSFPFLRKIFKKKDEFKVSAELEARQEFITDIIRQHQLKLDENIPNDFIDVFLCEMPDSDQEILLKTIQHLFLAGSDTTATTLCWGLLYMAMFPMIQERVQNELDAEVGQDRLPQMTDKTKLPFTVATLLEIHRMSSIAPLSIPHCAAEDTRIGNYNIPKGFIILANLWAVHNNPMIWQQPHEFNPDRFMGSNGLQTEQPQIAPFSIGRRMCLGENLAKMELFLFFTHLLHKFSFKKSPNSLPLSSDAVPGLVYSPKPFQIVAIPRK